MNTAAKRVVICLLLTLVAGLAYGAFLPVPEKLTLKNGISVYYLKNSDLPLISFRMWVKGAGFADEPADFEGVASLTSTLMLKGTATKSAEDIAEALDFSSEDFSAPTFAVPQGPFGSLCLGSTPLTGEIQSLLALLSSFGFPVPPLNL